MLTNIMTGAGLATGALITGSVVPKAIRAASGGDASVLGKAVVGFAAGTAVTALGGVAGFAAASAIEGNFETRRLLAAIQLHVSQAPSMSYSATWDNTELGALGAFGAGFSFGDVLTAGTVDYLTRKIIGAAYIIPRELGMVGDLGGAIESSTKKVNNPYKENSRIVIKSLHHCISIHDLPINYTDNEILDFIDKYSRRFNRIVEYIKSNKKLYKSYFQRLLFW
jgi:hypothetical protein